MVQMAKNRQTRQDEAAPSGIRQVAIIPTLCGDERKCSRCRTTFSCSLGKTNRNHILKYAA